jgi:phage tail sheath gpL-like
MSRYTPTRSQAEAEEARKAGAKLWADHYAAVEALTLPHNPNRPYRTVGINLSA